MLQLAYVSHATSPETLDLDALLARATHNNEVNEITGMLFTDGRRFFQVMEGAKELVEDTFLRIIVDPRHERLQLIHRRLITRREFGPWAMELRPLHGTADEYEARLAELCEGAEPEVQASFRDLLNGWPAP